ISRLIEKMVCLGLVTAWRLATWPTSRSPSLVNATTEGVVRPPSAFGMTTGSPPSMTATTELVVPRSMPMILEAMITPAEIVGGGACQIGYSRGFAGQVKQVAYRSRLPFWRIGSPSTRDLNHDAKA